MTPWTARKALVECLLAVPVERQRLAVLAPRIDRRFLALARAHGVVETAAHVLSSPELAPRLSAEASAALRREAEGAAARNALLLRDAAWLQEALAAEHIPSVALKGTALLAAHYPHLAARHVSDLDLLVAPAHVARADALLTEGLRLFRPPNPHLDYEGTPLPLRASRHHLPPLVTPAGTVCELHHAPPGDDAGLRAADIIGRSREVIHGGRPLRIPSANDLLAIACHHVLGDHRGDLRFRPRHLCDLAVLDATGVTFDGARALCRDTAALDASEALLASARAGATRDLFATPVHRLRGRLSALVTHDAEAGPLWRKLFPARAFLVERYGARGDSWWLPLLWLWRPFHAAARLVLGA